MKILGNGATFMKNIIDVKFSELLQSKHFTGENLDSFFNSQKSGNNR